MILVTGVATRFKRGYYAYSAFIGTGTTAATINVNGIGAVALPEFATSASRVGFIALPDCVITATLTGDAKLAVAPAG